MQNTKIKTYIGFAIRSNKIVWGVDNLLTRRHPPKLIIIDESLAENSRQKVQNYIEQKIVKYLVFSNLSQLCNKDNTKLIAITDSNLAKAIIDQQGEPIV